MKKTSGFTLIELMITLAIAAILITIGVPGFGEMMRNNRAATQANELASAMATARSESLKRGIRVSVCARTAGAETCSADLDWSPGWLLFTDDAGVAGVFDGADVLLRIKDALDGSTLTGTLTNVQYRSTGDVAQLGSFDLVPTGCTDRQQRTLSVSAAGRTSIAQVDC